MSESSSSVPSASDESDSLPRRNMGYWYVSSKCQSVWSYKYNMRPITPGESYMFCRVCNLAGRYEVFFFGDLVNLCK